VRAGEDRAAMTRNTASVTVEPKESPGQRLSGRSLELTRILGLEVTLSVVLAERLMTVESILDMKTGTIIEFDVPFDSELRLNIGNHPIGAGQTVKIGENFGLRLTSVAGVPERVGAMGR
jgi:flagellar motor switch protein FliN/FliY